MTSPILEQEEVNAVLDAIKMNGLAQELADIEPNVKPYDLTEGHSEAQTYLSGLDIVAERQSHLHASSLAAVARRPVSVQYLERQITSLEDARSTLERCASVVEVENWSGPIAIAYDPQFLYLVLEGLFGGTGQTDARVPERHLTPVETRLAQRLFDALVADFEQVWSSLRPTKARIARTESDPRFVTIAAPEDRMVRFRFEVETGDRRCGLSMLVPLAAIENLEDSLCTVLTNRPVSADASWQGALQSHLLDVEIETIGMLGSARLSLTELLELAEGDVLKLTTCADAEIELRVDDIPIARGRPEVFGGNVALRLTEPATGPLWKKRNRG